MNIKKKKNHDFMNTRLAILISIFMVSFIGRNTILQAQNTQGTDRKRVLKVISQSNRQPIPFSYLVNKRTGEGKESREDGTINMIVIPGDSIMFRSLGFHDSTYVCAQIFEHSDTLMIQVQEKSYELSSIDVYRFKSYGSFKQYLLSLDVPTEQTMTFNANIDLREIQALAKAKAGTFGLTLGMSGGKSRATTQLQAIKNHQEQYARLNHLTSHENIKEFTQLEGASLDSFIVFLRTQHKINPDLSDYKIMEVVQSAFEEFLAMRCEKQPD
ncbi:hypothetical protein DMA11_04645 [Marinilabiliaceae bacterium JC017]|nr:hypothetical protein DMA11_04645 [Marinilabiliaceae bacterium JC017]